VNLNGTGSFDPNKNVDGDNAILFYKNKIIKYSTLIYIYIIKQ